MNEPLKACTFLDKGGTGKTTTAAHLGVALAEQDLEVLLIDLAGKQGDLCKYFGLYEEWEAIVEDEDDNSDWPNIATTLSNDWENLLEKIGDDVIADQMIWETGEGPDLIPAHPELDGRDDDLTNVKQEDRYTFLGDFLNEYIEPLGYDAILIDLPGLTNNITYNGLWAARNVIAPVEMGPLEETQAEKLRSDLDKMSTNFEDANLNLSMVLPNKVDTRTNLAKEYLDLFREEYPEKCAPEHVPICQDIRNACNDGMTAFGLEDPSKTATEAAAAYRTNADALVDRLTGGN